MIAPHALRNTASSSDIPGAVYLTGYGARPLCSCVSSSQRSASIAAMQPEPAAVTAWR